MRGIQTLWIAVAVAVLVALAAAAYVVLQPQAATHASPAGPGPRGPGYGRAQGYGEVPGSLVDQVMQMPKEPLSDDEVQAILEMREEEKLARDVYTKLYEMWGLPIFQNIARSEQTHTDAVKALIEKYGLEDPVKDDSVGAFSDPRFTELYNQLVEKGSKSIVDALKVGATVEDLDIKDLEDWLKVVDNEDVRLVFCNLMRGSRNHLRAFVGTLEQYGGTYAPQFISEEEYKAILSGSMETGPSGC